MAQYKHTEAASGQGLFLSVNLSEQLIPGTFEYMMNDLIDNNTVDMSVFDENYKNDQTGAKAIPPSALIKLIIFGYRQGVNTSRRLEELSKYNIVAKALACDIEPHWTTIADFISRNSEKFKKVFADILFYCAELGLVAGETLACDGLRLPSNASKDMSGTEEELKKRLEICRKMAGKHIDKHRKLDEEGAMDEGIHRKFEDRQKRLNNKIGKISSFLQGMEKKEGKSGDEIKSNVTDNESAMIHSSKGYVQGYIGIAVTDKANQVIVTAEAIGSANEGEHLSDILDTTLENLEAAGVKAPEEKPVTFLADANYWSEDNLRAFEEREVDAVIPDSQYGRRCGEGKERRYEAEDFTYHKEGDYYECPNGKKLEYKNKSTLGGKDGKVYKASVKDCRACPLSSRCIRSKKEKSKWDRGRQLLITKSNEPGSLCSQMRKKLSTEEYQNKYSYRIQIVEPVFANISYCKGLKRFTLRGKKKVNGQWNLYCTVHNLGKCLEGYNERKRSA